MLMAVKFLTVNHVKLWHVLEKMDIPEHVIVHQ